MRIKSLAICIGPEARGGSIQSQPYQEAVNKDKLELKKEASSENKGKNHTLPSN